MFRDPSDIEAGLLNLLRSRSRSAVPEMPSAPRTRLPEGQPIALFEDGDRHTLIVAGRDYAGNHTATCYAGRQLGVQSI